MPVTAPLSAACCLPKQLQQPSSPCRQFPYHPGKARAQQPSGEATGAHQPAGRHTKPPSAPGSKGTAALPFNSWPAGPSASHAPSTSQAAHLQPPKQRRLPSSLTAPKRSAAAAAAEAAEARMAKKPAAGAAALPASIDLTAATPPRSQQPEPRQSGAAATSTSPQLTALTLAAEVPQPQQHLRSGRLMTCCVRLYAWHAVRALLHAVLGMASCSTGL